MISESDPTSSAEFLPEIIGTGPNPANLAMGFGNPAGVCGGDSRNDRDRSEIATERVNQPQLG